MAGKTKLFAETKRERKSSSWIQLRFFHDLCTSYLQRGREKLAIIFFHDFLDEVEALRRDGRGGYLGFDGSRKRTFDEPSVCDGALDANIISNHSSLVVTEKLTGGTAV